MTRQQIKQRGFTIIEVVLVLAIAALIFLMVFIALPALQRNQRDIARKEELQKVIGAVSTYQGNNRASSPDNAGDLASYLDSDSSADADTIDLPSGTTVTIGAADDDSSSPSQDEIFLYIGKKCGSVDGDTVNLEDGSSRQVAATVLLENGNAPFCQES